LPNSCQVDPDVSGVYQASDRFERSDALLLPIKIGISLTVTL